MEHVIELPTTVGSFKVVQIYIEELPYLPFNYTGQYHGDILEDFLKKKNILFEQTKNMVGKELPSLKGNGYEVVGMGYLDRFKKKFLFSRDSFDYNIGINSEHIEKCKPYFNNKDLEVIIE